MVKINEINYDPADYLTTPEAVRDYLQAALDEGDVNYFIQALNDITRSQGLARIFESLSLEDKKLFKIISTDKHPPFEIVYKALSVLNMKMRLLSL